MTMIIGGDTFIIICDQYYVSKKSETKVWKTSKLLAYSSHGENSKANYPAQPT